MDETGREQGLGFGFWARFAGGVLLVGIGVWLLFFFISRAIYAWGLLGMFVVIAAVCLGIGWFADRREAQKRAGIE